MYIRTVEYAGIRPWSQLVWALFYTGVIMCPTHYRPRELDSFLTDALLRTARPDEAKLEERNHCERS